MLPEVLSNFACSLRPNEEKYTFSAIFQLNPKAEVSIQWFGRTVIYSDQRFAYEEAQQLLLKPRKNLNSDIIPAEISLTGKEYKVSDEIVEATLKLDELAKILRRKRMNERRHFI
jgi:ribonuclease R